MAFALLHSMKKSLIILLIIPLVLFGEKNGLKTVKTPHTDSLQIIVKAPPASKSTLQSDSLLLKTLMAELQKKDGKNFWDILTSLATLAVPFVLGFIGYKYTRSQSISNARLEWIRNFRPLTSKFFAGMIKSQSALEDLKTSYKEWEEVYSSERDVIDRLNERYDLKHQRQIISADVTEIDKEINYLENLKTRIEPQAIAAEAGLKVYYDNYKKESVDVYQSLNEVIVTLDPETYKETQLPLYNRILDLFAGYKDMKVNDLDPLIQAIQLDINRVIVEQWQLAGGAGKFRLRGGER